MLEEAHDEADHAVDVLLIGVCIIYIPKGVIFRGKVLEGTPMLDSMQ